MTLADVLHDALRPLVAEREKRARELDRLDKLIDQIEGFDRAERVGVEVVPDPDPAPPAPTYPCTQEGCDEVLATGQKLGAHILKHNAADRRAKREADNERVIEAARQRRAAEADERAARWEAANKQADRNRTAEVLHDDVRPAPPAPPATSIRVDLTAPTRPPAVMVPSGLPRRPIDEDTARRAAFSDPAEDPRKG